MKKLSSNFSFLCRASKADRNGFSPVELSIVINGERTYLRLPMKCAADEFSRLRTSRKGNWLKDYLSSTYLEVQMVISQLQVRRVAITASAVKSALLSGGVSAISYTLGDLKKDYLDILKYRCSVETFRRYELAFDLFLKSLSQSSKHSEAEDTPRVTTSTGGKKSDTNQVKRFFRGADTEVIDVTNADVLRYKNIADGKFDGSTAYGYLSRLKSFFIYAVNNGKISINPFNGIRLKRQEKEVVILSDADYCKLKNKVIDIPRLEKVRDLFIFACNSGLSFCDINDLRPSDFLVVDGRVVIDKCRKKTGVRFYSVVLEDGVRILEKYDYCLPCISNQKTNAFIHELEVICNLSCRCTFHRSRHYYISSLIKKGVDISIVQKCAGHQRIVQTTHYLHLCMEDVVKGVNRCL